MASKKTTKEVRKLTCSGSISTYITSYIHLTPFSLSRCWAETTITWPLIVRIRSCAMRNFLAKQWTFAHVPILIFPVSGCSRMRSRISLCIRVLFKHTFTLEGGLLGHYPPGKIHKTNWECTCFYESARECARPQVYTCGKTAPGGNTAPRLFCQTNEHKLTLNSGTWCCYLANTHSDRKVKRYQN